MGLVTNGSEGNAVAAVASAAAGAEFDTGAELEADGAVDEDDVAEVGAGAIDDVTFVGGWERGGAVESFSGGEFGGEEMISSSSYFIVSKKL